MRRALLLALASAALYGSSPTPARSIATLAPFEVWADGLGSVRGLAVDGDDRLYVADEDAGTVMRIDPDGRRTIVARRLERPVGVAVDLQGRVLVAEERGGRVVRLDPTGPTPLARGIVRPRWLAVGEDATIYISARGVRPLADPRAGEDAIEPQAILALVPDGGLSVFVDGLAEPQGLVAAHGALYAATGGLSGTRAGGVVFRIPVLGDGRAGPLEPLSSPGDVRQPMGVAIDGLGALWVSAAAADRLRVRHAVVKLHPGGPATLFAAAPDSLQGLALDSHGHLYVADRGAGRVLRFAAPPPPVLSALPPFTNQGSVALSGTTLPDARVDVVVDHALPPALALSTSTGAFSATLAPAPNAETAVAVLATAGGGHGLTSPPAEASVVHDSIAPVVVLRAPDAGAFVRGPVVVRAEAADAGSHLAALEVSAAGRRLEATLVPPPAASAVEATAAWSTLDVPDGTHAVTATAIDRAGNSATMGRVVIVDNTPPDTELTGGPAGITAEPRATFAFTGSDNLTPVAALRFAWRLDGGPWSEPAADTQVTLTDLPAGDHVFEVVARDLAGNEDATPASRTFTVQAGGTLAITIVEPAAGATVAMGSTLARGTVDPGVSSVAVSVNGLPALVHGSQWALHVPIFPGDNVITAGASTPSVAAATATVTVNGGGPEPAVRLHAEPSSGVAPLAVTWRLISRAPRPLVHFDLDATGSSGFDPAGPVLDGTQSTYPVPGLMFPVVRATDDHGNVYEATTVVHVQDAQTASARFQDLWAGFKARLLAGDSAGALSYLTPSLRARFQPIFQDLGAELPAVASALGEIHLIDTVDDLAEAAIVQVEDGAPFLYLVYFHRDNRGRWLIQEM
jgi:sugar lactone lactonase YvrE